MTSPVVQALLDGNSQFRREEWDPRDATHNGRPSRRLAVVACMDSRYSIERVLGLAHGDAKIIRTAGAVVDEGALRSLVVAVHGMGATDVVLLPHTKCGMLGVGNGDLTIANATGGDPDIVQPWLDGFTDLTQHLQESRRRILEHPYLPDTLNVHMLLYDNDTGAVSEVQL